jgi:hypothetical protein
MNQEDVVENEWLVSLQVTIPLFGQKWSHFFSQIYFRVAIATFALT